MSGSSSTQAIWNQISTWLGNAKFITEGTDVDLVIEEVALNPDKYIDPGISVSENYEIIKDQFGLRGIGELEEFLAAMDTRAADRVADEIRDQLSEFGVDAVVDAINNRPGVDPALQQRVDDILEVVPDDAYQAEIEQRVHDLFRALGEPVVIQAEAEREERATQQREFAEREVRRELLDALRRELGLTFDSLDDAIAEIERRIEEERGAAIETGAIRLEIRPGDADVTVDSNLERWRDAVVRHVDRTLDLQAAQGLIDPNSDEPLERQTSIRLGTARLEDGQLAAIDLTEGEERLGTQPGAKDVEPPTAGEPDEPEQLAASLIGAMEGS